MNHERIGHSPRPQMESISSAMAYPGLWRIVTDGEQSLAELLVCADQGPDALETGIKTALRDGWPLLLVIPQITAT